MDKTVLLESGSYEFYSFTVSNPANSNMRFVLVPLPFCDRYTSVTVDWISYNGTRYTDFTLGAPATFNGVWYYSSNHTNIAVGGLVQGKITIVK